MSSGLNLAQTARALAGNATAWHPMCYHYPVDKIVSDGRKRFLEQHPELQSQIDAEVARLRAHYQRRMHEARLSRRLTLWLQLQRHIVRLRRLLMKIDSLFLLHSNREAQHS